MRIEAHPKAGSPDWLHRRYLLARRIIIVASAAVWMIAVVAVVVSNSAVNVLIALGIAVIDTIVTVWLLRELYSAYENAVYRARGG